MDGCTVYHLGGFDPEAPAENKAEEWDDAARTYTAWGTDGVVLAQRSYSDDDDEAAASRMALLDAMNQPARVVVQVDPDAVADALTAATKATTVASLRAAVVALAHQMSLS